MRVTFVINSLEAGGAERVLTVMANHWALKGWHAVILTFDPGQPSPFYDLHPAVDHRPLGIARVSANPFDALRNNLSRIFVLRRSIRQTEPQAVISFIDKTNVLTLLALATTRIPVIVSERTDPRHRRVRRVWNILRKWTYRRAESIVVQSERAKDYFPASLRRRISVIPNPVVPPPRKAASSEQRAVSESEMRNNDRRQTTDDRQWTTGRRSPVTDHYSAIRNPQSAIRNNSLLAARRSQLRKTVMGLGRLAHVKGFDLLLEAFSLVAPRHLDWDLEIWGEGHQRASLQAQAAQLGLQDRVRMPGVTKAPFKQLERADLFVLPSRVEGFPNALCEAMACGLPVISFDCDSGPREIIRDRVDGILVPPTNVPALASAMDRLMSDPAERDRLAKHAPDVLVRFGLERVMGMWEAVVAGVTGRRTSG